MCRVRVLISVYGLFLSFCVLTTFRSELSNLLMLFTHVKFNDYV